MSHLRERERERIANLTAVFHFFRFSLHCLSSLQVEQISHYGSEHYCPISVLRIFGASMMEEYEFSESQREQQQLTQPGGTGIADGGEASRRDGDESTTIGPDSGE